MPNYLDMVAGVGEFGRLPDIAGGFASGYQFGEGIKENRRISQARELTGQALAGDKNALRALPGVDPEAYIGVTKHQREDAAYKAERVASVLFSAKTPEEWNQRTDYLRAQGYDIGPEDTWENRDAVLNEFLTAKEQYDRDYKERALKSTEDYRNRALGIQEKVADIKTDPYALRKQAATDAGLDPESEDFKAFVLTGKLAKPKPAPSAAMEKLIRETQDKVVSIRGLRENLQTVNQLLDSGNVLSGYMPETRALAATALPEWATANGIVPTPEQGKATQNYSNIMNLESIKSMSDLLKGATTDRELAEFVRILTNPNAPTEVKKQTIGRMIALAMKQEALENQRLQKYNTSVPTPDEVGGGGGADDVAQAIDDANAAIAAGANKAAVIKQLQEDFPGLELDLGD